jgi:hypothetical protein
MGPDPAPALVEAPEPQQVGEHMVVNGDYRVDIGGNQTAPLQLLLDHRNRNCPLCTEGFVRRIEGGKTITKVCACCVDRYRKKAAQAARDEARAKTLEVARVRNERDEAAAQRRVERLSRETAVLEEEIAGKARRFADRTADLVATAARHAADAQDHATGMLLDRDEARRVAGEIAVMQVQLRDLHLALIGVNDSANAREEARTLALSMKADVDAELGRQRAAFEDSVRGARRDLERAQRRLARARGYNGLEAA